MRHPLETLGFAVVLALGFAPFAHADAPCQMQVLGEMAVKMEDGVPLVDAEIDGHPARMIIDTGSDTTLIFAQAAADYGVVAPTIRGARSYGIGGGGDLGMARLKSFKLAGLTATNYNIPVTNPSNIGSAQGLVGANFLRHWDLEFDFAHEKIRFFKAQNCIGDQVVYWGAAYSAAPILASPNNDITVMVKINGAPVRAQIDTGASVSTLTTEVAAKLGVRPNSVGVVSEGRLKGIGRETPRVYLGKFETFAFGDETIKNATLRVADLFNASKTLPANTDTRIPTDVVVEPDMLLGSDFLRYHRVYISRAQHMMYISYTGGRVFHPDRAEDSAASAASTPGKEIPRPAASVDAPAKQP